MRQEDPQPPRDPAVLAEARARRAAAWAVGPVISHRRPDGTLHYYLPGEAAAMAAHMIFSSDWFDCLVDQPGLVPPKDIEAELRLLAQADVTNEECIVGGQQVAALAGCLLHALGVTIDGTLFPTKTDVVGALRLLPDLPCEADEQRTLARRIAEACLEFLEAA